MGLFENFPYTNLHDLNLDWILQEVKKLIETGGYSPENPPPYPVTSVNGQTGAVILFNEQEGAYIRFPDSENNQWNIYRLVNGVEAGIQFSATLPAKRMQGANRFAIYDEGNQPPYPVTSINGKTGAVVLFNDQEGAYIRFPDSENTQWNVYRIIDGQANGIQFLKDGAAVRMQGENRFPIYDAGNPPPYPVTSVNGLTGAVETPFTDHTDDVLEFVAGAVGASWGLKRTINTGSATDEGEVEFTLQLNDSTGNPEAYIASGETVKKLLTEDDIPASSGVVSVNGKTGVVLVNGANTPMQAGGSQTVSQAIAAEAQARQQEIAAETQARQQADTSLNNNIAKVREGVAIIVDGDTASFAVPIGGYAWIKNNTHGLTDGMYKNTSSAAFPISGGTADSTVFEAIPTGAINELNSNFEVEYVTITANSAYIESSQINCLKNSFMVHLTGWIHMTNSAPADNAILLSNLPITNKYNGTNLKCFLLNSPGIVYQLRYEYGNLETDYNTSAIPAGEYRFSMIYFI